MKKLFIAIALFATTMFATTLSVRAADVTVAVSGEMSAHHNITTFISTQFLPSYGVNDPSLPITNLKAMGAMTYDDVTLEVSALELTQVGIAELSWFVDETVTLAGLSWTYDPQTGVFNQDGEAAATCVHAVDPTCSPFGVSAWGDAIANNNDSWMDFDTIPVGYLLGGTYIYENENPSDGHAAIFDLSDIGAGNVGARFYGSYNNTGGSPSTDYASRADFTLVVDDVMAVVEGEMSAHDNIIPYISPQFEPSYYGVSGTPLPINNLKVIGTIEYDSSNTVTALKLTQKGIVELSYIEDTVRFAGLSWTYDPLTGALNQDDVVFAECIDVFDPLPCAIFGQWGWLAVGENVESWMNFNTIPPRYLLGGFTSSWEINFSEGETAIFDFTNIAAGNLGARFYGTFNVGGMADGDYASRADFDLIITPLEDSVSVQVAIPTIALLGCAGLLSLIGCRVASVRRIG